jgi:hypothetical protein
MDVRIYELQPVPRQVLSQNGTDDVYLTIEIGNGQIGATIVKKEEKMIAKGQLTEPVYIGKVLELKDQEITVTTNVLDVNAFTDVCVIETTFKNQENRVLFTLIDKGDAAESGIARFIGKYVF